MRREGAFLVLLSLLLSPGCASHREPSPEPLVAFWLEYAYQDPVPVQVTHPHAVFLEWIGGKKRFLLYETRTRRIFKTSDFDQFLAVLERLPRGTSLQRFDACTVPRTYEMPQEAHDRLNRLLDRRNLSWALSEINGLPREMICYCESTGFRFP